MILWNQKFFSRSFTTLSCTFASSLFAGVTLCVDDSTRSRRSLRSNSSNYSSTQSSAFGQWHRWGRMLPGRVVIVTSN